MADQLQISSEQTLEVLQHTPAVLVSPAALHIACGTPTRDLPECAGKTKPAGRTLEWFRALAAFQGTDNVGPSGTPRPLPFIALAHEYRDTVRLATRSGALARVGVSVLALVVRITGRAPRRTSSAGTVRL